MNLRNLRNLCQYWIKSSKSRTGAWQWWGSSDDKSLRYSPSSSLKESYSRNVNCYLNRLSLAAINTRVALQGDSPKPTSNLNFPRNLGLQLYQPWLEVFGLAGTWNDSADKNAGEATSLHPHVAENTSKWLWIVITVLFVWQVSVCEKLQ